MLKLIHAKNSSINFLFFLSKSINLHFFYFVKKVFWKLFYIQQKINKIFFEKVMYLKVTLIAPVQ